MTFFDNKIRKIRNHINDRTGNEPELAQNTNPVYYLQTFRPTTSEELRKIVSSFPLKCAPHDPIPVALLKPHYDVLIAIWVRIVNLSLEFSCFDGLKDSVIGPLLKDLASKVDTDLYKNNRPISNIVFLSKLIERVVADRLDEHLRVSNLYIDNQFGYRKGHCTESLLTKLLNNLLLSCDENMPSILILLDLSAAFDTVDHDLLLHILENEIGIKASALRWFASFLIGRKYTVKINSSYSPESELLYGVPQGSVLGPILFNIYLRGLYRISGIINFEIDGFADDNQLVRQFLVSMQFEALGDSIFTCMENVAAWMHSHFLCLNTEKTKILIIAPPDVQREVIIRGVFLQTSCIRFVDTAKNLGILLDHTLTMETQINKVVSLCYCIIRKISEIRTVLSNEQVNTLVCCDIFTRLDYCNSLYFGLPKSLLQKLQRVQNSALRLVLKDKLPLSQSLDKHMLELHWLKVHERVIYKIALTVHKCLHEKGPNALQKLLQYADSARTMNLQETRVNGKYGKRAFSHVAPKLWNLIPLNIRQEQCTDKFKKLLKSHLLLNGEALRISLNNR